MKKAFVLLAVLSFMLVISANGGVLPWDYSDYNGQEGYSSEEVVENNTTSNVCMDLIHVSTLSGSAVCNGDGTMDVDLTIQTTIRAFQLVLIKKINDGSWVEIYRSRSIWLSHRSEKANFKGKSSGSYNLTVTETGLVSGDGVSYRAIYYGFKNRLVAVSNIESFTYQ